MCSVPQVQEITEHTPFTKKKTQTQNKHPNHYNSRDFSLNDDKQHAWSGLIGFIWIKINSIFT